MDNLAITPATREKYLELSGYCIVINSAFTFYTANILVAKAALWHCSNS